MALGFSSASAQTVDLTTPNQITLGSSHTWNGVTTGSFSPSNTVGTPLYDPSTNTIHFFGSVNPPASQIFAINQALANSGNVLRVLGYNYSWEINNNFNGSTVKASIVTYHPNGDVRRTDNFLYDTKFDWTLFQGTINYTNQGAPSTFGDLEVRFGSNSIGPQVRNVGLSLNYAAADPCSSNPLYSTSCSGYQQAHQAQQCTANALYDSSCPGYAAAYFIQQCSISPLSSPACPSYTTAALALVTKNTTTVHIDDVASSYTNPIPNPTSSNDAKKTITPNGDANPQAPVKLNSAKTDLDSGGSGVMKESKDKKAVVADDDNEDPKTNREALAKKRREEIKQQAVNKGKELAVTAGKAADMQTQMDIQNLVVQAMGYSPAFDVYSKTKLPDTQFYVSREIYQGRSNIDNPAGRRLFSGSDLAHQQMIDQQYNLGN